MREKVLYGATLGRRVVLGVRVNSTVGTVYIGERATWFLGHNPQPLTNINCVLCVVVRVLI